MNSIEALLSLFLLAGGSMNTPDSGAVSGHKLPEVKNLPDEVIIKATSNGCTKKRHFRIIADNHNRLRAIRIKADRCHKEPRVVEFRYSHKQMGLPQPIIEGNRLAGK